MSKSKNRGRVDSVKTSFTVDTATIYFGEGPSNGSTVDVHVYSKSNNDTVDFLEFEIEDLVDAFNNIPGVTATIDTPKEPRQPTNYETVRDLPVGSVFKWSTGVDGPRYIKVADNKIIDLLDDKVYDGYCPENFDHSDGYSSIVVIHKPEV